MNIKTFFLVCFLLTFFNIAVFGQAKDKVAKVVIDAGHGGNDPGTVGKLCKEKDLNLKIALRVGQLISDNFEDVTIIYTRKKDEAVELFRRAEIANKNKADLFISIHCNSAENKSATGVETFVMGLGKTEESKAIAKKENAAMLLEKDYQTNYSDFDPNSPEAYIIFSLYTSAYLNWSTIFASKVQNHLITNTNMVDRNVKQAAFWVLYKVAMPSILIELGFISNIEEEKYLLREETQETMAISIYNAFVEYKNLLEGTAKPFLPLPKATKMETKFEAQIITQSDTVSQSENLPQYDTVTQTLTLSQSETIPEILDTTAKDATGIIAPVAPKTTEDIIRFRIQFFTSKDDINTSDKRFASLPDIKKYHENNVWKYTSGDCETLLEAQNKLKEVKKYYSDAFIIAFRNEQKVSVSEAQGLLK